MCSTCALLNISHVVMGVGVLKKLPEAFSLFKFEAFYLLKFLFILSLLRKAGRCPIVFFCWSLLYKIPRTFNLNCQGYRCIKGFLG